jgi:hypothetical protein
VNGSFRVPARALAVVISAAFQVVRQALADCRDFTGGAQLEISLANCSSLPAIPPKNVLFLASIV